VNVFLLKADASNLQTQRPADKSIATDCGYECTTNPGTQGRTEGLGCLHGKHKICVDKSVPPVVHPCRKIPFALCGKLKEELACMEKLEVIKKIDEPAEWVSSLVVLQKKTGAPRMCLDQRDLNKAIKREHFKLPTKEEIMAPFAGAKWFSKLDASSGFWQLRLDEESSKLCTFTTTEGRYRFLRLPCGILSAPEVYKKTIHMIFEHIPGVETMMDDIIVWGLNREEHNGRLRQVLDKIREDTSEVETVSIMSRLLNDCPVRIQRMLM